MATIKELINELNKWAPSSYQESYDNSGLITGSPTWEVTGVLVTLDSTERIVEEAIRKNCNLILAHHPIVFSGLKSLTGKTYVERTIIKAIKHDIAILAVHTNLDNVITGVNAKIAHMIGLEDCHILRPKPQQLSKLVTFVPDEHLDQILKNLHDAGAGEVGKYGECSFVSGGEGRFKPNKDADPFIGTNDKSERVSEKRVEVLFPRHLQNKLITALKIAHPYEEVAYYIQQVENLNQDVGSGLIGSLPNEINISEFVEQVKSSMNLTHLKMTKPLERPIKTVAICGGAGSFLLPDAKRAKADVFVTADYKYHEFFDAEGEIVIMDIGHYESEVFTKELLAEYLTKKFTTFAIHLSQINTNPVQYY